MDAGTLVSPPSRQDAAAALVAVIAVVDEWKCAVTAERLPPGNQIDNAQRQPPPSHPHSNSCTGTVRPGGRTAALVLTRLLHANTWPVKCSCILAAFAYIAIYAMIASRARPPTEPPPPKTPVTAVQLLPGGGTAALKTSELVGHHLAGNMQPWCIC